MTRIFLTANGRKGDVFSKVMRLCRRGRCGSESRGPAPTATDPLARQNVKERGPPAESQFNRSLRSFGGLLQY